MRCALVHDWLTGMRGGEKVLEVLCELMPASDLYTLIHIPRSVSPLIEDRRIIASWLNRLPGVGRYYRYLLPLMPSAAQQLRLDGYDLVVATSHCVAHGVTVAKGTRFVCYCLTPMRYAWEMRDAYFAGKGRLDLRHAVLRGVGGRLRKWDRRASVRVTEYIADCRNVQDRIARCYNRNAEVIYPPVDTDIYHPLDEPTGEFYLWVGALAPYKRIDLTLGAFATLDRDLVVIGDGQDLKWARTTATPNVKFLGHQPDEVLRRYYATCRALIFPGEEDFGIVPLEAQACGAPVIAYGRGGALETIVDLNAGAQHAVPVPSPSEERATGILFGEPTVSSLTDAIRRFERNEARYEPSAIRARALRFSRERCKRALGDYLFGTRHVGRVSDPAGKETAD